MADVQLPSSSVLLRAGNSKESAPTDPSFWELRPHDLNTENLDEIGVSTFKKTPASAESIFSNPKANKFGWDTSVEIPTSALSENGLQWNNTPTNFFKDPALDQNHFVIQHPKNLATMPKQDYLKWWNSDMAVKLANWAKSWIIRSAKNR
jgi:hypothetical protein